MNPELLKVLLGIYPPPLLHSWEMKPEAVSGAEVVVRVMRQEDLGAIAEILASSFHQPDGWLYPVLRLGIREDLRSRLRGRGGRQVCLVVVERAMGTGERGAMKKGGERILGTVEMSMRGGGLWQGEERLLYLSNLAVGRGDRRRGVGVALMRACEEVARIWGEKSLFLHVLENNEKGRRLYEKAGFRLYRTEIRLGNLLFGQPKELMLYKKV